MEQVLFLNTILYLIVIFFLYKKEKSINLQIIVFLWYCFISICGVIAVHLKVYYNIYGYNGVPENCLLAYTYVCFSFFILTSPLKKISINNLKIENDEYYLPKSLFKIIIFIIIAYFFLKIYEVKTIASMNFGDIYTQLHEEGKAIITYNNPILIKLSSSGYMIYSALFPFIVYYLINKILKQNYNKNEILLLVIVALIKVLEPISNASRGGLVLSMFDFLFFLFIFWNKITKKIKIRIFVVSIASIISVFIILMMITSDRVGTESEYIFNSFVLYLGETFPNITYRYWDHVTYHPMGERLFILRDYGSLGNFFDYWNIKLHINTECFKTLPIDLYIEYGKIGAVLFLIILSSVFKKIINNHGIKIWIVGLFFWYYQLCVSGAFSFSKRGETNYKIFLLILFFSFYLHLRKNSSLKRNGAYYKK